MIEQAINTAKICGFLEDVTWKNKVLSRNTREDLKNNCNAEKKTLQRLDVTQEN